MGIVDTISKTLGTKKARPVAAAIPALPPPALEPLSDRIEVEVYELRRLQMLDAEEALAKAEREYAANALQGGWKDVEDARVRVEQARMLLAPAQRMRDAAQATREDPTFRASYAAQLAAIVEHDRRHEPLMTEIADLSAALLGKLHEAHALRRDAQDAFGSVVDMARRAGEPRAELARRLPPGTMRIGVDYASRLEERLRERGQDPTHAVARSLRDFVHAALSGSWIPRDAGDPK